MLGTRFVATRESRAHALYKQALVEGSETALTYCFDGGWPNAAHRVLVNSTLRDWEKVGSPTTERPGEGDRLALSNGQDILRYEDVAPREGMTGEIEAMCLYAGMGCGLIDDVPSVSELMERLITP